MSLSPTLGRFDYLDGIRAIAIGAVLSLHWLHRPLPLMDGGSVGVDIFFVLSGFIITSVLWRGGNGSSTGDEYKRFLVRRVRRLYPALAGLVSGVTILYLIAPMGLNLSELAIRAILVLTQTSAIFAAMQNGSLWVPDLLPFTQTWSLAIEWYFYILWPLMIFGAKRRRAPARRVARVCAAAALLLYLLALPQSIFWFYFGPTARFSEILAGAALALWLHKRDALAPASEHTKRAALGAMGALVVIIALAPGADSLFYRFASAPLAVAATLVLIYAAYRTHDGLAYAILTHPWITAVGRGSYSLYLWNIPILLLIRGPWSHVAPQIAAPLIVVSTALAAYLSFRYLEKPYLTSRNDVLSPRTPTAVGRHQIQG